MSSELARLLTTGHADALGAREALPFIAAGAAPWGRDGGPGEGRCEAGFQTLGSAGGAAALRERLADVARRTVCVTLLAGAGSRWVRSLREARARGEGLPESEFPEGAPRGLYPVADRLSARGAGSGPAGKIPIAAYSLDALRGLGRRTIVVRGWETEIRSRLLDPLGIGEGEYAFFTQETDARGKVAGHGDAVLQCLESWKDADYVVANFGGDANSPLTAMAALLALDACAGAGDPVGLVVPVALAPSPAYPVRLDERGFPASFGHDKLGGAPAAGAAGPGGGPGSGLADGPGGGPSSGLADGMAYTNVGVRVYRASALRDAAMEIRERWWSPGEGYSIPGNDPEGREFALDNADALLAARGMARVLAAARPAELTPAKSWDAIPGFESAIALVRAEWDAWRFRTGFREAP